MIDGWAGMWRYAPRVATLGAIFFFSLAGIPPLAGWCAKFAMFLAILRPANPWATALAVIAAVNAVILLVYYARVAKTMWMVPLPEDAPDTTLRTRPLSGSLGPGAGHLRAVRHRRQRPTLSNSQASSPKRPWW